MSVLLAIETATSRGSVALWRDGSVAMEEEFDAPRGHSTAIFAPLERILEEGGSAIDRIVVGTGPGSYGGVRVGIAVANTLGVVKGIPVVGVSSLLAPGSSTQPDYTVIGDARRREFFVARVRGRRLDGEIALYEEPRFREVLEGIASSGESIFTFDESVPAVVAGLGIEIDVPEAGVLAARYAEMTPEEAAALEGGPLEPIYLRSPYITTPKEK